MIKNRFRKTGTKSTFGSTIPKSYWRLFLGSNLSKLVTYFFELGSSGLELFSFGSATLVNKIVPVISLKMMMLQAPTTVVQLFCSWGTATSLPWSSPAWSTDSVSVNFYLLGLMYIFLRFLVTLWFTPLKFIFSFSSWMGLGLVVGLGVWLDLGLGLG